MWPTRDHKNIECSPLVEKLACPDLVVFRQYVAVVSVRIMLYFYVFTLSVYLDMLLHCYH